MYGTVLVLLFIIIVPASICAQQPTATRGIGKYPGNPAEFFGPQKHTPANEGGNDNGKLKNLALHRAAWASSTVDYNLTAHLVTDGIVGADAPVFLTVRTNENGKGVKILSRREAEWAIDGGPYSSNVLMGERVWIEYNWGLDVFKKVSAVRLEARMAYDDQRATHGYRIACQVSADGQEWQTAGELTGDGLPGSPMRYKLHSDPNKQTTNDYLPAREIGETITLASQAVTNAQQVRFVFEMEGAAYWDIHELHFLDAKGQEVWLQPSQSFTSAWVSNGGGHQWLCVDLGAPATIERVTPHWVEEPKQWHAETTGEGRFVTIVMEEPAASGRYALRELEVWGTGGVSYEPHEQAPQHDGRLYLSGGQWQLQRASEVSAAGETIASEGFNAEGWIWATVPGTVLTSYMNIGAVPDPNYADWVDQISESFFRSNFWYRDEFVVTSDMLRQGTLQRLHFDGINWKANVFLNGHRLGRIEGAFMRGEFDVSRYLREGKNVLAVEIICNEHFGSVKEKDANTTQFNGGILGADNPTFHATIGWDWITSVRGRNAGIWNEVYLTSGPQVTLSDPYVRTKRLNSDSSRRGLGDEVSVTPSVFVRNHGEHAVNAVLQGWIGDVRFEQSISLPAHAEKEITFSPADFPQLTRRDFRLWWPNGYGEPYRYEAGYRMINGNGGPLPSSPRGGELVLKYKAGLREMTYKHVEDSLLVYVNGRRFVPLGGNWGFDEHNLCYRSREYMTAVAYHRDMHCTMIRNWVGMIGDEAFYEACDSLGLMVWQDFWLANPADGPDPYSPDLFMSNARDYVRRIRRYAAIGLYCGRNEGYPPANIDSQLRACVGALSPGMVYIPSSADDCVTGHGPYSAQPARVYFERQSGKIHTERGMPAVMNIESLRRTFAPDSLWPQSTQWGQHDYTLHGAQRAEEFNGLVQQAFGPSSSAEEFARRAQLINYNGYRAMFESTSRTRSGLLIWMSHPCWPSMVWQTYDYYFDPTASYFGTKKACEPLHIQYNALTDSIEIVNAFAGDRSKLTAVATAYDLQGRRLWRKSHRLDSRDDTTTPLFALGAKARSQDCALLRLELRQGKTTISQNDYYLGNDEGSLAPLLSLPKAKVEQKVSFHLSGDLCTATVTLTNRSKTLAPFLRLNLLGTDGQLVLGKTFNVYPEDAKGQQILPAIYSDNYITLLPDEQRTITISYRIEDGRGQLPVVELQHL